VRDKPKVGDELFLVDVGNAARNGRGSQRKCVVSKVGRKYFDVTYGDRCPSTVTFVIATRHQKTEYCANAALYDSEQHWADSVLADKLGRKIADSFRYSCGSSFTLDQLRKVAEILEISEVD
jgi:hypothetical protein